MKGLGKILLVEENETRRKNIARFFSGEALPIQESLSFPDGANRLLNSNDFTIALLNALFFETHEKNFLQKIRTSNPQLSIILMTSEENSKPALFLLKQKLVDQITSADNLASLFSAVNSEIQKTEVIRKSEFLQSRFDKLHKEQKKNIQRTLELEEIYDSTLENLMTALDLRDVETFGHSRTVAKYSQLLARTLNIKDRETLDNIRKGALLHDVGKIAIPDVILKKPTPLTPEEWKKIRLHPSLGYGLIKEIKLLNEVGNIILYHHEKYDGSGYPKGLKNDEIPLEARIFALADALDAITSFRPYRKERDFQTAKKEIQENSGKQFDPKVVDAFCSIGLDTWEKIRFETTQLFPFFMEAKIS
jgi:putative nucleotidyltransferase with HDIG domain